MPIKKPMLAIHVEPEVEDDPMPPILSGEVGKEFGAETKASVPTNKDTELLSTLEKAVQGVSDQASTDNQKQTLQYFTLRETSIPVGLSLLAVSHDGLDFSAGYILTLTQKGKIHLHSGINHELGLQLDENGRIKIE